MDRDRNLHPSIKSHSDEINHGTWTDLRARLTYDGFSRANAVFFPALHEIQQKRFLLTIVPEAEQSFVNYRNAFVKYLMAAVKSRSELAINYQQFIYCNRNSYKAIVFALCPFFAPDYAFYRDFSIEHYVNAINLLYEIFIMYRSLFSEARKLHVWFPLIFSRSWIVNQSKRLIFQVLSLLWNDLQSFI